MLTNAIFAIIFTIGMMISTTVSAESRAIQLIKGLYTDILDDDLMGEDVETIRYTPQLRSLLKQLEDVAEQQQWEMCEWIYEHKLIPGNDRDTQINQMKFNNLPNGRVRAQGINFGEYFFRDFEVKCTENSCKINDIFDPTASTNSYQQSIRKIIKNKNC